MTIVNPSGPRVLPPDSETARACLLRRMAFHHGTVNAFYLAPEIRARAADKAADIAFALDMIALGECL